MTWTGSDLAALIYCLTCWAIMSAALVALLRKRRSERQAYRPWWEA